MTRPTRVLAMFVALTALAPLGCKKSADSVDADGGGGEVAGGIDVRYKAAAFKLKQDTKFSFKFTSKGGAGEATADVTGLLDVTPSGADKLKVAFSVAEVRAIEVSGGQQPKPKEGEAPVDPKAVVLASTGATIVDLKGDLDAAATKALPETAALKAKPEAEAQYVGLVAGFLGLPDQLPEKQLVEGTPSKTSKREKKDTPLGQMDMDISTAFTLVKIDAASGKRIAEIKFESESSGAREQGDQQLSVDAVAEGTLMFNLDDQLPVALKLGSTYSMTFGSQGSAEIRTSIDSTFTPA